MITLDLRGKHAFLNGKKIGKIVRWETDEGQATCYWDLDVSTKEHVLKTISQVPVWTIR